jgi:hypothetical protein
VQSPIGDHSDQCVRVSATLAPYPVEGGFGPTSKKAPEGAFC